MSFAQFPSLIDHLTCLVQKLFLLGWLACMLRLNLLAMWWLAAIALRILNWLSSVREGKNGSRGTREKEERYPLCF